MKLTDEQLIKIRNILIIVLSISLVFTAVASILYAKSKKSESSGYSKMETYVVFMLKMAKFVIVYYYKSTNIDWIC